MRSKQWRVLKRPQLMTSAKFVSVEFPSHDDITWVTFSWIFTSLMSDASLFLTVAWYWAYHSSGNCRKWGPYHQTQLSGILFPVSPRVMACQQDSALQDCVFNFSQLSIPWSCLDDVWRIISNVYRFESNKRQFLNQTSKLFDSLVVVAPSTQLLEPGQNCSSKQFQSFVWCWSSFAWCSSHSVFHVQSKRGVWPLFFDYWNCFPQWLHLFFGMYFSFSTSFHES